MGTLKALPQNVGKRVHGYLFNGRVANNGTRDFIDHLSQAIPQTVVFGGMIRDLGFNNAREFKSDIDLVCMADKGDILSVVNKYNPTMNKFGGFRFIVGHQLFDIWAYQDTWAFKEKIVKANSLEDLCATTFFNVDAAYQPIKSRDIVSSFDYLDILKKRVLDINLEENPAPQKIAARAIRMAISCDLAVSPRLQQFIIKNTATALRKNGPTGTFLALVEKHIQRSNEEAFRFAPQENLL